MAIYTDLFKMYRNMEQEAERLAQKTAAEGLSLLQLYVLDELYREDGQHPSDLALAVGRAATAFTPVLDGLERKGLICRVADLTDRRAVVIHLNRDAKAMRADVKHVLRELDKTFAPMLTAIGY